MTTITLRKSAIRGRGLTVIDPLDGRERPFCSTLGKLFALAMSENRYLRPTREEDAIWCQQGQALIDARQQVLALKG